MVIFSDPGTRFWNGWLQVNQIICKTTAFPDAPSHLLITSLFTSIPATAVFANPSGAALPGTTSGIVMRSATEEIPHDRRSA